MYSIPPDIPSLIQIVPGEVEVVNGMETPILEPKTLYWIKFELEGGDTSTWNKVSEDFKKVNGIDLVTYLKTVAALKTSREPDDILISVFSSCGDILIYKEKIINSYCRLIKESALISLDLSNLPVFTIKGTNKNLENKIKNFFNKRYGRNKYNKFVVNKNIISITTFTKNQVVQGWEKLQFVMIITPVNKNQVYISVIMDGSYNVGFLDPRISREKEEDKLYPIEIANSKINNYINNTFFESLVQELGR